jgi:RNA polymerase sigma-70 factor (ECF subfamily)
VTDWVRHIYEDHRRLLFRVAWLIVRRTDLAEDAVHTAFSRIVSRPPDINGNAKGYVMKAVRNAAIDIRRQLAAGPKGVVDDWEQIPARTTISRMEGESFDAAQAALATLEGETQEIIHLHIHERMTFREIGELIDVPLQTVASRYRRGLRQIQAKVRDDDRTD